MGMISHVGLSGERNDECETCFVFYLGFFCGGDHRLCDEVVDNVVRYGHALGHEAVQLKEEIVVRYTLYYKMKV